MTWIYDKLQALSNVSGCFQFPLEWSLQVMGIASQSIFVERLHRPPIVGGWMATMWSSSRCRAGSGWPMLGTLKTMDVSCV
jgi:hypothetical protein